MSAGVLSSVRRLVVGDWRWTLLAAILLLGLLIELQYAIRYVYLVPVWELALFDEMLINRTTRDPVPSLWSMAWGYSLNGHWMLLPFWFFWADFAWDNASGLIPMIASWVSLLILAVVVATRVSRDPTQRVFAGLWVAVAIFWPAAMESMISPLQLVTSFSLVFGALALLLLERSDRWGKVAAAWVFAFLSMASFGYGVVLWPILMFALLRDRRWKAAAATLVVGILAIVLYRSRAGSGYFQSVAYLLPQWQNIVGYLFAQAGAVLPYLIHQVSVLPAQILGGVLISAQLMMSVIVIRRSIWEDRCSRWLCLFAGWLLGAMLLTALARHGLGAPQGLASRYLVPSTLYLVCLLALAWRLSAGSIRMQRALLGVAGALVLAILVGAPVYAERFAAVRNNYHVAMLGETVGVREVDANGNANQWLNLWPLQQVYRYLRENRMSVFREEWATWLGAEIGDVIGDAAQRRCEFSLDQRTAFPAGDRVMGWVYSSEAGQAPQHVLFVQQERVVGLAAVIINRPDVADVFKSRQATKSGYYGYIPTLPAGVVQGYALFADGSVCQTGEIAQAAPAANAPG